MRDERTTGQKSEYAGGNAGGNPPPHALAIGRFLLCGVVSEIGLGRNACQLDRCASKAVIDRRGWQEIIDLLDEMLSRQRAIQEESSQRLASSGEEPVAALIATLAFETAPVRERANGRAHVPG